jgi:hypothetical protein
MTKSISNKRIIVSLVVPFLLFAGIILLIKYSLFDSQSAPLAFAISADFLLTIPLVYFLLIRKTSIPKTTVVPIMIIGLLLGSYFLPQQNQTYLSLFKTWALPLIELTVFSFVILKVRKAFQTYKSQKHSSLDFFMVLKNTCYEILPKLVAIPFATEIAVAYYGFIHWKTIELKENQFSYHKKSGTPALLGTLILLTVVETCTFHILLGMWSEVAAWIATGLSVYTSFQLFGFAKSLSKRPIEISPDLLKLKYGIMSEAEIPFEIIDSIELSRKKMDENPLHKHFSPLGELEGHNIILHLKQTHSLVGLYGFRKEFVKLAVHVDEAKAFLEVVVESKLNSVN